jgi:hypothetical protein
MGKTNFSKLIQNTKTFNELETLKQGFLNECEKQYNRIAVATSLLTINNFGDAKMMFESIVPALLNKKSGKSLIKKYTNIIKENQSLKTLYTYYEGLKENNTPTSKKNYITEALSLGNKVDKKECLDGIEKVVGLIAEAFKIVGTEQTLELINLDKNVKAVNESLDYLVSTPKTVKNLNTFINHMNTVSETIVESDNKVNLNIPIKDVLKNDNKNMGENVMESIFDDSVDRESTFNNTKAACLSMIKEQCKLCNDSEILIRLDEMATKLNKKSYNYETYTKDMIFMSELQEVLN